MKACFEISKLYHKRMRIIQEFKEFAIKGNVVDLAVGVIIGGAFGKIITSLVNDIIMPPFGVLLGGSNLSDKVIILKNATETAGAVTLNYGLFLNNIIDFAIISFAIFFAIKQMNRLKREEPKSEPAVEIPADVALLTEIRDLLKK